MKKRGIYIYIMLALIIAVLAFLLVYLMPSSDIDTPAVILPTPQTLDSAAAEGESNSGKFNAVVVTPENVQAIIALMDKADNYSRTLTVESFWTGGTDKQEIGVWVRGDEAKLAIRRENSPVKHILIQGREKWIWYSDSEELFHGIAGENDADEYQTLLSYEDVLNMDSSLISEAGYAEYAGEGCIYMRYKSGELDYDNLCYVSVDTGLMVGSESYDGDELIYRMQSSVTDLSTPDNQVFELP